MAARAPCFERALVSFAERPVFCEERSQESLACLILVGGFGTDMKCRERLLCSPSQPARPSRLPNHVCNPPRVRFVVIQEAEGDGGTEGTGNKEAQCTEANFQLRPLKPKSAAEAMTSKATSLGCTTGR